MNSEPLLPSLQITQHHPHRVMELRPAHWACDWLPMVLLMLHPNFQALCVHTFVACPAGWIALSDHILVANRASLFFIEGRKILNILGFYLTIEFLSRFKVRGAWDFLLFHVLKLNKPFKFGVEVGSWVKLKLPCHKMAWVSGTLYFLSMT